MKTLVTGCLMAITFSVSYAQKEYPVCEKTFFKSGQVSTEKCFDKENRFGKAYAYTKSGKLIYEKGLRKIAGHESVYFTFYPGGAVKKAEWSSAPDAGIQWYNSTDEFSEDGTLINHTENNYDDYLRVTTPFTPKEKDTVVTLKEKKADTLISTKKKVEVWFLNHTYYPVIIHASGKNNLSIAEQKVYPGDSTRLLQYDFTTKNFQPEKKYNFQIHSANKANEESPFIRKTQYKILSNQNRAFFYTIENKSK